MYIYIFTVFPGSFLVSCDSKTAGDRIHEDISHEASGLLWIRQLSAKWIKRIPGLNIVPVNRYHIGSFLKNRCETQKKTEAVCAQTMEEMDNFHLSSGFYMFFWGWFFGLFHHGI